MKPCRYGVHTGDQLLTSKSCGDSVPNNNPQLRTQTDPTFGHKEGKCPFSQRANGSDEPLSRVWPLPRPYSCSSWLETVSLSPEWRLRRQRQHSRGKQQEDLLPPFCSRLRECERPTLSQQKHIRSPDRPGR